MTSDNTETIRKPEYSLSNLNDLIDSVIELMKVKAAERKVKLSFEPDDKIEEIVIDQKGIYRCVLSLISNAIDACNEDDAAVTLRTKTSDSKYIVVEIEDQGPGMHEETLQSIFQSFFYQNGSKGTGLGLSVTQKIIQEHEGRIEVDSVLNRGNKLPQSQPVAFARSRTVST